MAPTRWTRSARSASGSAADRAVHAEGLGATWLGRSDCNSFSIGVELINFGTAEQYIDQAVNYDLKKNDVPEYGPVSEERTLARLETSRRGAPHRART